MDITRTRTVSACVAILIALVVGCGKPTTSTKSDAPVKSVAAEGPNTKEIDEHGDEVLASAAKAEARQWMSGPSHIFFKADHKEVAKFVEEFYGAGAKQVLIADIEEHDGKQFGEGLLVVLPKEAATRTKLFEIGSRADDAFQNDPVRDKGQKYLYYSLD